MNPLLPYEPAPITVNLEALISSSTRLGEVLNQESILLKDMQIRAIAPLQDEKIELSNHVALNQQLLQNNPAMLDDADPDLLAELMEVTEALQDIITENMRLNDIARNVNQRVVKVISDAMRDHQRPATYTRYGRAAGSKDLTVSFNLNQQA